MMRHKIAILSDIHGNLTALRHVLEDAKAEHATEYWFLGDLMTPGPGTNTLFKLLNSLNLKVFIRGNWDDLVLTILNGDTKYLNYDSPGYIHVAKMDQYISQSLAEPYFEQLQQSKMSQFLEINGLKIQITHNVLEKNFGHQLLPYEDQHNFDDLIVDPNVDIAVYGHTHHQLMRTTRKEQIIINPGAIGQPYTEWKKFANDLRAEYALLDIDDKGYANVSFKRVSYNIKEELNLAKINHLPYYELYDELLHTGIARTHDFDILKKYNDMYNYRDQVIEFVEKVNAEKLT
ncbi:metallophosphoesterase family protein [Lactobacillus salsicarnum]|uniref:Metallophosphoesterase family protein n=2 Tax=Companilactobacillus mishanensis TaxID=2486008 RepID=A0A5P0ZF45_9LACO|nr:metallophosphoesterase family protein [Companilactobacillus mishanensis]